MSKTSQLKFLFTGGGTGGHVAPGLAIAEEVKQRHPDAKLLYVAVKGKAADRMVRGTGIALSWVCSRGFPGFKNIPYLFLFMVSLLRGIIKSIYILLSFRPNVIIATGGYVAAPIIFAAGLLRTLHLIKTKIFIHEQNVVLGKLNKLASGIADIVGISFPETASTLVLKNVEYVGYPVRQKIRTKSEKNIEVWQKNREIEKNKARTQLTIPLSSRLIFAFGGSQGARTINRAIVKALPALLELPDVYIIHATGKQLTGNSYNGAEDVNNLLKKTDKINGIERYKRFDFIDDMQTYYAAADIVISRAGAGTIKEICAQGVAAIIIPKANLPGDHQVANARSLESNNGAQIIYEGIEAGTGSVEESIDINQFVQTVKQLIFSEELLKNMSINNRLLHDDNIIKNIGNWIDFLAEVAEKPESVKPEIPLKDRVLGLSSSRLDNFLIKIRSGTEKELDEKESRLVHYKIDNFLSDQNYIKKARGCRMAGRIKYKKRLDLLISYAISKKNNKSYVECPIVRRDAFVGIGWMGLINDKIIHAFSKGLDDFYYEVKAQTAIAITRLAKTSFNKIDQSQNVFEPVLIGLLKNVNDKSFDVRIASIKALSSVCNNGDMLLEQFRTVYFDPVWKVRKMILDAFLILINRGILDRKQVSKEASEILITSNGYLTHYELKESLKQLYDKIGNRLNTQ